MGDGTISGGMIPKLETCVEAVEAGVEGAVIIDGRVPHSLLLENLTISQVRALMGDGTISGGMIPKLETCLEAVEAGVEGAVIIDGRVPHSLLLEIFTERGVGTFVSRG